jgi:hypothetical protein
MLGSDRRLTDNPEEQIKLKTHVPSLMSETSLSLLARVCRLGDSDSWNRLAELYAPLLRG